MSLRKETIIRGKRIFITGGGGFIASHINERLVEHNDITVYDILQRDSLKYTDLSRHKNLKLVKGDVLDLGHLKRAMQGAQIVIHCAAIAGIYSVVKSPSLTLRVNFLGTHNALEAAVASRARQFIDFSTSEVYGPFAYKGTERDLTCQGPVGESRWAYAVGKLAAEHLAHAYEREFGLAVTTVRPFNIYGPRQIGEGAVRAMILKALRNQPITLYNDGTQIRAWCFVGDFVEGIVSILSNPGARGLTFNLGNPQGAISNLQLAQMIKRLVQSDSKIIFKKHPGPEVEIRVPSIHRAQKVLKYKPRVNLEEGILRTIEWYRGHGEAT